MILIKKKNQSQALAPQEPPPESSLGSRGWAQLLSFCISRVWPWHAGKATDAETQKLCPPAATEA